MRWRKATWAIIIWTALMAYVLFDGMLNTQNESAEKYEAFYFIILGFVLIFWWFFGLLILAVVWLKSQPKENTAIYGPQGQWMMVTEKDAKKRVEKQGWTYQPQPLHPQQYQGQQPPHGGPPQPPPAGPDQPQVAAWTAVSVMGRSGTESPQEGAPRGEGGSGGRIRTCSQPASSRPRR